MLAKKYRSEIFSIQNPLEGIYTLEFKSLGRKYKYHPGQFLHLAIDEEYDGVGQWPQSRCFSMQSNSNQDTIRITYAVKGGFTANMEKVLHVGDMAWLKLPYGDLFQQPHNKDNTVFISGGTGITPFLSLFSHESFTEYCNPKIYLGFRSKDHHIYHDDLKVMEQILESDLNTRGAECNNRIQSGLLKTFYQDSNGVIDINQIYIENGNESNYFISGPPEMIRTFKSTLVGHSVPKENVLSDDWE